VGFKATSGLIKSLSMVKKEEEGLLRFANLPLGNITGS